MERLRPLLPIFLGLLAVLALRSLSPIVGRDPFLAELARDLPWVTLGAAAVLGLRLNRVAILLVAAAFAGVLFRGAWPALPWAVLLATLYVEKRLLALRTIVFAGAIAASIHFAPRLAGIELFRLPVKLPDLQLLGFVLLVLRVTFARVDRAFMLGAASAVLVSIAAELDGARSIGASLAGLVLLLSVLELYWQKVYIDELTEVPNRRALNEHLRTLGRRFTIAMVDIDFFKKFNDTYGHDTGDQVLRFVAAHLAREAKSRVFRYGGEEFCVVYRGKNADEVVEVLDGLRERLARTGFVVRTPGKRPKKGKKSRGKAAFGRSKLKVTVSIGVADRTADKRRPDRVMESADKALYKAKRGGRNQVVAA